MNKFAIYATIAILSLILFGCTPTEEKTVQLDQKNEATSSLNEYYSSIDYSCSQSTDCAIKNVGNCCGEYKQCANIHAKVDPSSVDTMCAREHAASVCGQQEIKSCSCVNRRCTAQ